MLLGLHAGDSLGATIEFLPASPAWNTHTEIIGGGEFHWKPGEATDDTDLMLCVLKSIRSIESFDFNILKAEMLNWYHSKPPDIGNTTKKGLANLEAGLPLRECGFVDNTFQGNGSIMRVAPLALMKENADGIYKDAHYSSLLNIMITQTKMTHGHQHCVDSDVIFIAALKSALAGDSKQQVYDRALQTAKDVSSEIALRIEALPHLSWSEMKTSGFCVDTLCAALWAFLKYNSLEESVTAIVNRGDDADSCGAVTGALCGAHYGVQAVPERWLQTLELKEAILQEIKRLSN
ncbi:ADP-ribosylglycohydrolase family protein [Bdellovibrio sp. HCB337]|uniref:ADP-ribosylglycohydrolase family protein n=1 Tax=Bdellovibrio sp. HCB337 TaxID=3394358 RepID=UPI0039A40BA8